MLTRPSIAVTCAAPIECFWCGRAAQRGYTGAACRRRCRQCGCVRARGAFRAAMGREYRNTPFQDGPSRRRGCARRCTGPTADVATRFRTAACQSNTAAARNWLNMLVLFAEQFFHPDGLVHQPLVGMPFVDTLVRGFLLAAEHSHRDALMGRERSLTPRAIRDRSRCHRSGSAFAPDVVVDRRSQPGQCPFAAARFQASPRHVADVVSA